MREILFKAKRKDNGEWVEGYYCKWKQIRRIICVAEEKVVDSIITWMSDGSMLRHEIDPDTLCQFTGLTDKNGKKILENDIVKLPDEDCYFKCEWDEDNARLVLNGDGLTVDFDNYYGYECEVVGNIFDNEELLEVE